MKIAIIGASGNIGRQFLSHFVRNNQSCDIVATVRRVNTEFDSQFPNVKFILCDLRNPWQIDRALQGVDTIVNLSGKTSGQDEYDFLIDNYYSIVNLFKSAKKCGVKKIIHVSSIYASVLPDTIYGKSKKMADDFIRDFSGVQSIIIRPTWIISEQPDKDLSGLLRGFRFSPLAFIPETARTKPLYSKDFFHILDFFIFDNQIGNQELDVCGDSEMTVAEVYRNLVKNLGLRKLTVVVPAAFAFGVFKFLALVNPFMRQRLRAIEERLNSQLTNRIPEKNDATKVLKKFTPVDSIKIDMTM